MPASLSHKAHQMRHIKQADRHRLCLFKLLGPQELTSISAGFQRMLQLPLLDRKCGSVTGGEQSASLDFGLTMAS